MSVKSVYGEVAVAWHHHVAVLEIDRPPNNHVSVELMKSLADALEDIDAERDLRVSIIASAGKNFCAGADLAAPAGIGGSGGGVGSLYVEAVRLFSTKKPIVAAVQGAAVGAGLGLALVADFRIAAPDARFTANFVKIGFHPGFGITHTLPRVIGEQRAALLCLTGRRIKAEEALAWGLVDEVVPLEKLRDAAMQLAREIAENAPLAVEFHPRDAARRSRRQGEGADRSRARRADTAAQDHRFRRRRARGVRTQAGKFHRGVTGSCHSVECARCPDREVGAVAGTVRMADRPEQARFLRAQHGLRQAHGATGFVERDALREQRQSTGRRVEQGRVFGAEKDRLSLQVRTLHPDLAGEQPRVEWHAVQLFLGRRRVTQKIGRSEVAFHGHRPPRIELDARKREDLAIGG